MLPTAGNPPRDVLAVLRAHAARAGGENQLLAMGAQPLSGGRNNAAYRWDSPDGPVCVKIYRVDKRRRAEREWLSLAFLSGHQTDSAPAPLWTDPDLGQPAIGLTFVPFTSQFDRARRLQSAAAAIRADHAASCP